jgi:hypothetical protein
MSYSSSEVAATASDDGGQIGDRNWILGDFDVVLGEELRVDNKMFYPNPVQNQMFFYDFTKLLHLEIYDSNGRRVLESEIKSEVIDVEMLNPGLYFTRVLFKTGEVKSNILLKK